MFENVRKADRQVASLDSWWALVPDSPWPDMGSPKNTKAVENISTSFKKIYKKI